jgi:recombinational DNA repair protein RecT
MDPQTSLPARTNGTGGAPVVRTPRDQFAAVVLAVASKELTALFGSEQGKAAAARVALAFRAAASTAKDPEAFYSCSPESVASAMATSAFTQIMPGGPFCGCYLIPKKVNGVQTLNWWINHRGIKTLARRAGQSVEAVPYFEGDEIIIKRGRDWVVEVIEGPTPDRDSYAAMLGFVYYVSDLESGALLAAGKVSKAQIQKRRAKGQGGSVWNEWPMEMSAKTVIKYAAGRGDVFFDDVGNMAMSREAEATDVIDTTATESAPQPAPGARRLIPQDLTPARDFGAEQAAAAARQGAPIRSADEEPAEERRPTPTTPLDAFRAAIRDELGIDPAAAEEFLGLSSVDLSTEAALKDAFNSLKKGGARRVSFDKFLNTASNAGRADDDGSV